MRTVKIPSYDPKDREQATWVRAVTAALNDNERTIEFDWNSDNAPVSVRSGLTVVPVGLRVIDAVTSLGAHVSSVPISWTWDNGSIVVSAIGTLTASTDYTVTIGVVS